MVKTSLLKRQAKVYLKIAHRQLAMAEALLEKGFYEGAVFHCYHAFEAVCSAGIANKGRKVPLPHREKFNQFRKFYPEMIFAEEFASLVAELYPKRERSLYADIEYGEVSDPTLEYKREDAEDTMARARSMVNEIERLLTG
ncbi:MAG: HEPN domain-containing protein [Anaerolineae bacterium]